MRLRGAVEGLGRGGSTAGAAEGFGEKRFSNLLLRLWITAGASDFERLGGASALTMLSDCERLGGGGGGFSIGAGEGLAGGLAAAKALGAITLGFCLPFGERERGLCGVGFLGGASCFGSAAAADGGCCGRCLGRPRARGFTGSTGLGPSSSIVS